MKISVSLLLFCCCTAATAQPPAGSLPDYKKYSNYFHVFDKPGTRLFNLYACPHPDGSMYLTWCMDDRFLFSRIDSNFRQKDYFTQLYAADLHYKPDQSDMLAHHFEGEILHTMLYDFDKNKVVITRTDFAQKKSDRPQLYAMQPREYFIDGGWHNGAFYYITSYKRTPVFIFYKNVPGQPQQRYEVPIPPALRREGNRFKTILQEAYTVTDENAAEPAFTAADAKIYFYNNQFIFTLDNYDEATQIITVNLGDFTTSYQRLEQPYGICAGKSGRRGNSLFFDKYFIQINNCLKQMHIDIRSRDDFKLLQSFHSLASEDITYASSDILHEITQPGGKKKKPAKIVYTGDFLRHMSAYTCFVSAAYPGNQLLLKTGAYQRIYEEGSVPVILPLAPLRLFIIPFKYMEKDPLHEIGSDKATMAVVLNKETLQFDPGLRYIHENEGSLKMRAILKKEFYERTWEHKSFYYGNKLATGYTDQSAGILYFIVCDNNALQTAR